VFSRYVTPQDCVPRWELLRHSQEITVGGVRVAPGDWIVADADGIVVVPSAVCEQALARAEAVVATENEVRDAVRAGTLPREAFERYGEVLTRSGAGSGAGRPAHLGRLARVEGAVGLGGILERHAVADHPPRASARRPGSSPAGARDRARDCRSRTTA